MLDLAHINQRQLETELELVERDIGRARPFERHADPSGLVRIRVSAELLALAEQEHLIVTELHRRGVAGSVGAVDVR